MIEPWPGYPYCPCGTDGCFGQKLSRATGHVKGCLCPRCRGREAHAHGHRSQERTHRKLGGKGKGRNDEEKNKPYTVEVAIQAESKAGQQVPQAWHDFVMGVFFLDALAQATNAIPVGSAALPGVSINDEYVIVDIRTRRERERTVRRRRIP